MSEVFIPRDQAARQVGCFEARMISIWRDKGHPLPKNYRAAIRVNGQVIPARDFRELHSSIVLRFQPMGETVEEGFVYTVEDGQPQP